MKYLKLKFVLKFEKEVTFRKNPSIILRSVLGKELKRLTCVLRQVESCSLCQLNRTCVYSWFFESNIPKDTSSITGRNKGSHPFIPYVEHNSRQSVDEIHYEMTLLGRGVEYVPYIYFSLQKAGEQGLFKERIRFTVSNVISNGMSILDKNNNKIISDGFIKEWFKQDKYKNSIPGKKKLRINFVTPFRFKKEGKFQDEFKYMNILQASSRRMRILFDLYEEDDSEFDIFKVPDDLIDKKIIQNNTKWVEFSYYSHRQNSAIKFGGIKGSVLVEGYFTAYENYLLDSASKFNIGKNISFGLGKVDIIEEESI